MTRISWSRRFPTGFEAEGKVGVAALLEGLEANEPGDEEDEAGARAARERRGAPPASVADDAADEDEESVRDRETKVVHLS